MTRIPVFLALALATAGPVVGQDRALTGPDSALHVLNRLAFGPRPGDIAAVSHLGVESWIESQVRADLPEPLLPTLEQDFQVLTIDADEMAQRAVALARERRAARRNEGEGGGGQGRTPMQSGPDSPRRLAGEFEQVAVVRAVVAENQLREVMVDFWTNHFNVVLTKGADRYLLPSYIEKTIRPHAMGRFQDLLVAVAESPAMLFYLDNVRSVAPGSEPPALRRAARFGRAIPDSVRERIPTGINENYARELLELHTLGVDGGYTQQDVINTARILTGWGMERPDRGASFEFHDWAHDRGSKVVLGVSYPAGHGQDEGLRLLAMLANQPATMHHIGAKLCARFVSDDPPDGCIDAAVRAWQTSNGDIRQILLAIFHSPEFWAPGSVNTKFKTPFEFVVSAARATAIVPTARPALAMMVAKLGQPLHLQPSPAGFPETEADWVNSGALLERMNLAMALVAGRVPGAQPDLDAICPASAGAEAVVAAVNQRLFAGGLSDRTRTVILREAGDPPAGSDPRAYAVGLALGGPEFQRQ
jgi:uncharacterized protein (DUF1800 family)